MLKQYAIEHATNERVARRVYRPNHEQAFGAL
jgi:hypothetical protein